jgi:hypothetical protein
LTGAQSTRVPGDLFYAPRDDASGLVLWGNVDEVNPFSWNQDDAEYDLRMFAECALRGYEDNPAVQKEN